MKRHKKGYGCFWICLWITVTHNNGKPLAGNLAELFRQLRINGFGILPECFAHPEKFHHIQPPFAVLYSAVILLANS
jgi:hypothetical protein